MDIINHITVWFSIIANVLRDTEGNIVMQEFSHALFSRDRSRVFPHKPGQEIMTSEGFGNHLDYILLPHGSPSSRRQFAHWQKGYDKTVKLWKVSDARLLNQMFSAYEDAFTNNLNQRPLERKMLFAQYGEENVVRYPLSLHEVHQPDVYKLIALDKWGSPTYEGEQWYKEDETTPMNGHSFGSIEKAWTAATSSLKNRGKDGRFVSACDAVLIFRQERDGKGIPLDGEYLPRDINKGLTDDDLSSGMGWERGWKLITTITRNTPHYVIPHSPKWERSE